MSPALCVVGDLVTDTVVELGGPVALGTDTTARITRRRGGAAANLATTAAALGADVRFVGHVGDDPDADTLEADLRRAGVEPRLRRGGRTGAIVVLVDEAGERTMLADRASAPELTDVGDDVLDGVDALCLTGYALLRDPERTTVTTLATAAHGRGVEVHLDVASAGSVAELGGEVFVDRLVALSPDVVHLNADEAALLASVRPLRTLAPTVVVHAGPDPAVVHAGAESLGVPAIAVGEVTDTTGAGDAFVAGWIVASLNGASVTDATRSAHAAAAHRLHREEP